MRLALAFLLVSLAAPLVAQAQDAAKPILRMQFEETDTVPGQPLVLRVTVLAPTWLPEAPVFQSFEVPNVMVRLPERASGPASERVNGETWSGVTRAYRLYPMTAGVFRIPPLPITVTYADPETREPLTAKLMTDEVVFRGTRPEGGEDLEPFIAAAALTLEQTIEGDPGTLKPGDAVTLTVTVKVKGTSPIFLPPLIEPLTEPGFAAYPKEPLVIESEDRGVLSGQRVEQVTYVAEAGGRVQLPPVRLRWYNLREALVETAEGEGFEMIAVGPPSTAPSSDINWRSLAYWIVFGASCLLILSLVARRLWPRLARWHRKRRDAYLTSEAYAYAQSKQALRKGELGRALGALALWSSRLPAGASMEEERLSKMLTRLGAALYRRGEAAPSVALWDETEEALGAARRLRLRRFAAAHAEDRLLPLNPQRAR